MSQHTPEPKSPLPWSLGDLHDDPEVIDPCYDIVDAHGHEVAGMVWEKDARYIVASANDPAALRAQRDSLLADNVHLRSLCESAATQLERVSAWLKKEGLNWLPYSLCASDLRSAIARAEGGGA